MNRGVDESVSGKAPASPGQVRPAPNVRLHLGSAHDARRYNAAAALSGLLLGSLLLGSLLLGSLLLGGLLLGGLLGGLLYGDLAATGLPFRDRGLGDLLPTGLLLRCSLLFTCCHMSSGLVPNNEGSIIRRRAPLCIITRRGAADASLRFNERTSRASHDHRGTRAGARTARARRIRAPRLRRRRNAAVTGAERARRGGIVGRGLGNVDCGDLRARSAAAVRGPAAR